MSNLIKVSVALLAAIGAKTESDFSDALANKISGFQSTNESLKQKIDEQEKTIASLSEKLKSSEKTISALSDKIGSPEALTENKIREIAKAEGSRSAMEAVGSIGASAPVAAPSVSASSTPAISASEALDAAGKHEEAWAASKALQAEFPTAGSYAAWFKNQDKVRVIGGNRNK